MANKLAIITGASTGIGYELARIAAAEGYDLVIAANESRINTAAEELRSTGVQVTPVEADLAALEGVDRMLAATVGRNVDLLVANAGVGTGGPFLDQAVEKWRHSIDTNVTGTLYLLQKVLRDMVSRSSGRVLVVGSIAGFIPGTFNAVYNGTKALIDSVTEALRNELKDVKGVTLTTLMPGATETEFFERAGMGDTKIGQEEKADPAKVARDGWDALMAGKGHIVSGLKNKAQVAAAGVVPQSLLAEQHRKQSAPGSADSSKSKH